MFSFSLRTVYHRRIFFFGLILMAVGLPFSKVLMSLSQGVLLLNWLWEGDLKNKLKMFWHNKAALVLSSLPVLYFTGMLYSTDLDYALNDIRIKLPLIILPLIFSTSFPLFEKRFRLLMRIFSVAVVVSTFFSIAAYFGYSHKPINNLRDISVFTSHIRFSLLICIAILFLFYSALFHAESRILKQIQFVAGLWLAFFLFFMESMTGVATLLVSVLVILFVFSFRQNSYSLKLFYSGVLLIVPVFFLAFLFNEIGNFFKVNPVNLNQLEEFTKNGEKYVHDLRKKNVENGNYIWIYYAPQELEQAWNERSAIPFSGKDRRGQSISYTLMRFLTSKNLRKDAEGVNSLSDEEIKAVESGDANILYLDIGLRKRIHQIIWEFNNYAEGENPQGNSITQRLEFWNAAWRSIRENPVIGVGSGDLKTAMNYQFGEMKTLLEPQYWLKPHNQYITMTVTFGFLGLCWFIFFLFAPPLYQKIEGDFFYISFFAIALLSMITEDTLDTQAGISFFTFFSCLFLFRKKERD